MAFALRVLCPCWMVRIVDYVTTTVEAPAVPVSAEQRIRELVAAAPPLTPRQREELAALVRPTTR